MKLRPLHDRIVVKRLDIERTTASGIVIPDNAAEKPDQGEIVAVGNGKITDDGKTRPVDAKVGDKVLFGKYSGQTVKVDGDELLGHNFSAHFCSIHQVSLASLQHKLCIHTAHSDNNSNKVVSGRQRW